MDGQGIEGMNGGGGKGCLSGPVAALVRHSVALGAAAAAAALDRIRSGCI